MTDATAQNGAWGLHQTYTAGGAQPFVIESNGTEQFRITSSGNVGIGTTAPHVMLHVHRAAGSSFQYVTNDGTSATDHSQIWFATNFTASPDWAGIGIFGGDGKLRLSGSGSLNVPGLTVDNSNNVGIGTTTPDYKLHVLGGSIGIASPTPQLYIRDTDSLSSDDALIALISFRDSVNTQLGWIGDGSAGSNSMTVYSASGSAHLLSAGGGVNVSAAGNVGIGTATPSTALEIARGVSGDFSALKLLNTQGSGSVQTGVSIDFHHFSGTIPNAQIKAQEYDAADSGSDIIFSTQPQNGSVTDPLVERMRLSSTGNVGIGTTAPSHILHITGQGRSTVASWATSSDMRVKEDIHTITGGLDTVGKLRPVTFRYTDEYQNGNPALGGMRRGFIAQEVEAVLPDTVTRAVERVGAREISDFRVLGNSDFVPLLVSAVKELKAANDNLKAENGSLRVELHETINSQGAEIDVLRRRVEALEATR